MNRCLGATLLAASLLTGCSGVKTYSESGAKNLSIRTDVSGVRAALHVHDVRAGCLTDYRGTVELDRPPVVGQAASAHVMDVQRRPHPGHVGPYREVLRPAFGIGLDARAAGEQARRQQRCAKAPVHGPRLAKPSVIAGSALRQIRAAEIAALRPPAQRLAQHLVVHREGVDLDASSLGGHWSGVEHDAIGAVGGSSHLDDRAALLLDMD